MTDEIFDEDRADDTCPLAVVTGASSGIGFELARRLADLGYDLIVASSNAEKLRAAAEQISDEGSGIYVEIVVTDLSQPSGAGKLYEAIQRDGRCVSVLAANAGVGLSGDFADETRLEDEIALINLNVTSQVHLIKLISRDMKAHGGGDILITSSIAGTMPGPWMAVYAASKAFLRSFGQAIRQELKEDGVNVTVLMPGPTDTEFFERADMLDTKAAQGSKQDPAEVAEAAIQALQSREDHVVPGLKNKLQAGMEKVLGDETRAKIQGAQTRRGTP
jgi:short-subunit dehydrogenase